MTKSKLGTWLKKRLEGSKSRQQSASLPPYVPLQRPRPPSPTALGESISQPPTCLLFTKLPTDIRRTIFIAAFGDRTLHIDLVFDHLLLSPPPAYQRNHAWIYTQDGPSSSGSGGSESKIWRWGGAVCHRNGPYLPPGGMVPRFLWEGPWNDQCMLGEASSCEEHEGQWPDKRQVGIMGFLLSCKQAYIEGIEILYGTNCISIASEPLMRHLPDLIPPQRLASVTSIELLVRAHESRQDDGAWILEFGHLTPILDHLTTHCRHHLRSVCLSLEMSFLACSEQFLDGPTLSSIDAFFLSMQLRDMRLEVPQLIFNAWKNRTSSVPVQHALENAGMPGKAIMEFNPWRCFDDTDEEGQPTRKPEMQWRTLGNYPKPPLQLPTPENADKYVLSVGYWITEGAPDPTPPCFVTCS